MYIPIDPVILLLGIYPIEICAQVQRYMYRVIHFNLVYSRKRRSNLNVHQRTLNKLGYIPIPQGS